MIGSGGKGSSGASFKKKPMRYGDLKKNLFRYPTFEISLCTFGKHFLTSSLFSSKM